jgi:hypothetical protein
MSLILSGSDGVSDIDGSASTPAIRGTDANTGIFFGSDIIGFAEGGAEAMRIDSDGDVGIGTTSPAVKLDVEYADTSFNAGIRVTNTSNNSNSQAKIYAQNSAGDYVSLGRNSPALGSQSSIFSTGAFPLQFFTDSTERARITSGGFFKAQGNSTYGSTSSSRHEFITATGDEYILLFQSNATNGQQYGVAVVTANDQNDATRNFIKCDGAATERFTARSNGGLANYSANNVNLASDERLKKDISPLETSWDKVKQIEVVNFRYKDCNQGDPLLYGVIAQQVQPIVPELVVVTQEAKEATEDKEATPEYFGIREQPMYWLAIKALQEAQLRIETLEAQNAAFETRLAALENK